MRRNGPNWLSDLDAHTSGEIPSWFCNSHGLSNQLLPIDYSVRGQIIYCSEIANSSLVMFAQFLFVESEILGFQGAVFQNSHCCWSQVTEWVDHRSLIFKMKKMNQMPFNVLIFSELMPGILARNIGFTYSAISPVNNTELVSALLLKYQWKGTYFPTDTSGEQLRQSPPSSSGHRAKGFYP